MNGSLWKNIKEFLSEKLYITVTPSSTRNKIKNFSFRRVIPIIIILLLVIGIGILSCNYLYYKGKYKQTQANFQEFKNSVNIEELQEENKRLKKNLLVLSQNTEELMASLRSIKEANQEIRYILGEDTNINEDNDFDEEINITSILRTNSNILKQGIPMGGSELNLYYHETDKLIEQMKTEINIAEDTISKQRSVQNELKDEAVEYKDMRSSLPNLWPLADSGNCYISSNFGWRIDPISNQQEYHEGLDIAVWYNTPVVATAPGKVTFVGWNGGYGLSVKVEHGHGYSTYYAHLNKSKVSKGDKVTEGEVIALTGNSGKSTGPHLHYEVRINGVPKNPRKFIGR
ncbi:MAG TPA: peptidoglycan DD-metalloendopeptidase family protein [Halanaerobiales bacterium]|nr:peptidoglycan DD-metalloendopeptidase family protein [Halanaerobiales bacterium]